MTKIIRPATFYHFIKCVTGVSLFVKTGIFLHFIQKKITMKSLKVLLTTVFTIFCIAAFAQQDTTHHLKKHHTKQGMEKMYCCAMHKDVMSNKPGKCPKCGKNLSLSKKEEMKMEVMKLYTCPMHADQTGKQPGKCPKCGMDMTKKKE
jgi:uncharacterized protein with PIN domain